jgi:hypothetical protein
MRKKAFILFLSFLYPGIYAQLMDHNIVVLSQGKKFILYVNGEKVNPQPEMNVKAFHINEGWCKLKAELENGPVISDSIKIKAFPKNNNKEITYTIDENKKKFVFVSMSDMSAPELPPVPEPPYTGPVVDNNTYGNLYRAENGKPVFFHNYKDSTGTCSVELNDKDIFYGLNLINNSNDIQNRYDYIAFTVDRNCYTTQRIIQVLNKLDIELDKLKLSKRAYTHLSDPKNAAQMKSIFKFKSVSEDFDRFIKDVANAEHQKNLHCKEAISEANLQDIIARIKKGQYEPDRLEIAKQQVINNCLSTIQVDKLIQLFGHDREKMDLAKSAYAITIDKDNYKNLADNFQFSENRTEFLKFLEK